MKQPTEKLMKIWVITIPPVHIKSIDFINSSIAKLKIDNLDFGNNKFLMIPFNVPRGSHLKGLVLSISKSKKVRKFTLRYWLGVTIF